MSSPGMGSEPNKIASSHTSGDVIAHRYRLDRRLGEGGRGTVYLARDLSTGALVAVKVARDNWVAERVRYEAHVLRKLNHPNLCKVLDRGSLSDKRPFTVFEYVDAVSLDALIEHGPCRVDQSLGIIARLADVLAHIHAHGYLHRDIKPLNILVPIDESGHHMTTVRLIDFDLARRIHRTHDDATYPLFGLIGGTIDFMAPEQISGRDQDVRTDVYGLGATLFALVYGRTPHSDWGAPTAAVLAETGRAQPYIGSVIVRRLTEEVLIPADDRVPSDVRDLLATMLRLDPQLRPASAADVYSRVQVLHGRLLLATPHAATSMELSAP